MNLPLITPDWPAPPTVHALTTTRQGGISVAPFHALNLALHVGDHRPHVIANRQILATHAQLPESPRWLNQIHGIDVIHSENWTAHQSADAIFSQHPHHVCAILTADCLPILICDRNGHQIAAIHAGWRGLAAGIIERTCGHLHGPRQSLLAWLGPAISAAYFEVGEDVVSHFIRHDPNAIAAFVQTDDTHFLADLFLLARQRLQALGITHIYGGNDCTYAQPNYFYSYRREGQTGRMASLIWIAKE